MKGPPLVLKQVFGADSIISPGGLKDCGEGEKKELNGRNRTQATISVKFYKLTVKV